MDLLDFSSEKEDDNCILREIEIDLVSYNKVEDVNKSDSYKFDIQKENSKEYEKKSTKPKTSTHLLPENINSNYQMQENFNSQDDKQELNKDASVHYDLIVKDVDYIIEETKNEVETNRKANDKSEEKKEVKSSSSNRSRPEQKREVDQNTEGKGTEDFVTVKSHSRLSSCDQSSIPPNPITQRLVLIDTKSENNLFGDEKSGAEEFEALFGSNLARSKPVPISDYSQSEYSQRSGYGTNIKPQTGCMQKESSAVPGRTKGKGRNPFNDMESEYAQPVEQ